MSVRLAIGTPVVTMHPASHSPWEASASIEEVAMRIVRAVERRTAESGKNGGARRG